jgi:hypothetical protein
MESSDKHVAPLGLWYVFILSHSFRFAVHYGLQHIAPSRAILENVSYYKLSLKPWKGEILKPTV